jgi:hypothetical protein
MRTPPYFWKISTLSRQHGQNNTFLPKEETLISFSCFKLFSFQISVSKKKLENIHTFSALARSVSTDNRYSSIDPMGTT